MGGFESDAQIIIRGSSALSFWRHAALVEARALQAREDRWLYGDAGQDKLDSSCACNLLQRRRRNVSDEYTPHLNLRDAREIRDRLNIELPIKVHAARPAQNRSTLAAVTVSGVLPDGQLIFVEPGVWVVSPELCLADLARETDLVELLMLAYEFCGFYTYGLSDGMKDCELPGCAPRTTPGAIAGLADQLDGVRGVKNLRFAAKHVLLGSRSPRESSLAAIFTLPHNYGGYALMAPRLNCEITLGEEASRIWGHRMCELDGCWLEEKLAYEYQSSLHNTSASRDAMKRMALEQDGWRVINVGNGQITHEAQMDVIAREIARHLGKRLSPRSKNYRKAQRKLFNSLVRYRRF